MVFILYPSMIVKDAQYMFKHTNRKSTCKNSQVLFYVDQPGLEPGMTIASQDTPTAKGKCPID